MNLIRKDWSASILGGCTLRSARDARAELATVLELRVRRTSYISSRDDCTETGPFTVESRIIAGELPNSMRRLLSSHVFRALSQMLALQLIGE